MAEFEKAQTAASEYMNTRPTGHMPMMIGWCCLGLAILLLLISLGAGPESYEVDYARKLVGNPYASTSILAKVAEGYSQQLRFQIAAGAFFSLFLILWSVGYIVKAISFLPAAEKRPAGRTVD